MSEVEEAGWLEVWRVPVLSAALPDRVVFQSTRIDLRGGILAGVKRSLGVAAFFFRALGPGLGGSYRAMLTRAHGPVRFRRYRVLLWLKSLNGWLLRRLIIWTARRNRLPLVVLDLEDNFNVHRADGVLLRAAVLYYKRELGQDLWPSLEPTFAPWVHIGRLKESARGRELAAKLKPVALGPFGPLEIPARPAEPVEKTHDVFFAGRSRSTLGRDQVIAACEELRRRGYRVLQPAEALGAEDYFAAIRSSWLSLSPAGNGWDCYRHYEVASQGCVAVMNYPRIRRQDPYLHGESCFYYDDQGDLAGFLEGVLADKANLARIGARAGEHHDRHHTAARVLAMMENDLAAEAAV